MEMARQSLCFPAWPFGGVCIRGRKPWKTLNVQCMFTTHVLQAGNFLRDESLSSASGASMYVFWRLNQSTSSRSLMLFDIFVLTSVLGMYHA